MFHLDVIYVLQWLHTCFSSIFRCFASVSDVCCMCFGCRSDLMLHMLQRDPPAVAGGVPCMRIGSGGGWRQGREVLGV